MAKRAAIVPEVKEAKKAELPRIKSKEGHGMSAVAAAAHNAARARGAFHENMDAAIMIDKHALDDCLVQQPELFHKVAERLALEVSLRDEAKNELSIVMAEVDEIVRLHAETSGTKVTETAIKMQIQQHPDVVMARNVVMGLEKSVGLLQALKESYNQRSYALKDLVSLYLAQYYGDGTAVAAGSKERQYDKSKKSMNDEREKRRDR